MLAKALPYGSVLLPAPLEPLVRSFLYSESVLNYGQPQSEADNEAALGALDLHAVNDGDVVGLPRHCYAGPMRGLSVQVFAAPHKSMPAVAYGLFRYAKRLKPEYAAQQHRIAELVRASPGLEVSEKIKERLLFYSGDTTIGLLERSAEEVRRALRRLADERAQLAMAGELRERGATDDERTRLDAIDAEQRVLRARLGEEGGAAVAASSSASSARLPVAFTRAVKRIGLGCARARRPVFPA